VSDDLKIEFTDSESDGESLCMEGTSKTPMQSKRFMIVFLLGSALIGFATFVVWCVFFKLQKPEFTLFTGGLSAGGIAVAGGLAIQFVGGEKALHEYAGVFKAGINKVKPPAGP